MSAKYIYRGGRWVKLDPPTKQFSKRYPNPEGEFVHVYERDGHGPPKLIDIQWYQLD